MLAWYHWTVMVIWGDILRIPVCVVCVQLEKLKIKSISGQFKGNQSVFVLSPSWMGQIWVKSHIRDIDWEIGTWVKGIGSKLGRSHCHALHPLQRPVTCTEAVVSYLCDRPWDCEGPQSTWGLLIWEYAITQGGDSLGDYQFLETWTLTEGIITNGGHYLGGDDDLSQGGAQVEGVGTDVGHPLAESDSLQGGTALERVVTRRLDLVRNNNRGQMGTVLEWLALNEPDVAEVEGGK